MSVNGMMNSEQNVTAAAAAPTASAHATGATDFQAQEAGAPEQHNGTVLLVEAYAVLWCILMAWIVLLWRKQNGMNTRLDDLERVIDKAAVGAEKNAGGAGK